jgi:SAM-dependent methyltransferase
VTVFDTTLLFYDEVGLSTGTVQRSTQEIFDSYWQTREYRSADARTRQRVAAVARLMQNSGGNLLDVGCGRGYAAEYFSRLGFDVLGIDVSPQSVRWTADRGVPARVVDLDAESFDGCYATIICLETLQYVRDPLNVLRKLREGMAPGGETLISLPCEYHLLRRLSILLTGRGPGGIDFPLTVFYPAEHRRLFARSGLRITDACPISLVPPRWGMLVKPGQLLARLSPSLFALSVIYRLEAGE